MPRNGSGTYTLPAGNPVVTGTTISSTVQNNTMSDVASALTQSLTKDGQTVPTANLPMGGFKLTNVADGSALSDSANFGQTINQPATITLASAATVNIGAALSSNITISGTTTITAFDNVVDGITRNVTFSGALALTHNATSLILPGAANIATAVGDCATFQSLGSGNWRCTKYVTASGFVRFAKGANIASAATVDLTAATGNTLHITGTTGISAWTMTSGQLMDVIFDGVLTLTHNATTNNLPGAANITTAAGDRARYSYDGTTVYCLSYTRADGKSVVANVAASSQAEVEAASSTTTYVTPGRMHFHLGMAKAVGFVTGATGALTMLSSTAGTITCSRTAAGTYSIGGFNFSTNCFPMVVSNDADRVASVGTASATSLTVNTRVPNGSNSDANFWFLLFGDMP